MCSTYSLDPNPLTLLCHEEQRAIAPYDKPNQNFIMIAVIEIGGKQYTVETNSTLVVDRQHVDVGTTFTVPALLLAQSDASDVRVGTPTVEGSKVVLRVEEHAK
jgi:hypothetical protein